MTEALELCLGISLVLFAISFALIAYSWSLTNMSTLERRAKRTVAAKQDNDLSVDTVYDKMVSEWEVPEFLKETT